MTGQISSGNALGEFHALTYVVHLASRQPFTPDPGSHLRAAPILPSAGFD
jgi:hypothetical protein